MWRKSGQRKEEAAKGSGCIWQKNESAVKQEENKKYSDNYELLETWRL